MDRRNRIDALLRRHFTPTHLEVVDESHRHAGHAGAAGGGGHFRVLIVSAEFRGQTRIARERAVHAALGDVMRAEVHALSLRTFTPEEWDRAQHRD